MRKSTPEWPFADGPRSEYACLHCGGVFPYEKWLTGRDDWPWWCPNGTPYGPGCDGGLLDMHDPEWVSKQFSDQG